MPVKIFLSILIMPVIVSIAEGTGDGRVHPVYPGGSKNTGFRIFQFVE